MLKSTIRALQSLLDDQRVLAIAVAADGVPYAGLLPFAPAPDRSGVFVHASRLARHSRGLAAGSPVGILLHEPDLPGKDPLQLQRAMFECRVTPLARDTSGWQAGRDRYLARFPAAAVTFDLGDFTLFRLEFTAGLYVAGFGRAIAVPADDIARLATAP
jgi:putative heme iron utilization protein